MTENLTQRFVHLSLIRLASQIAAELRLYHAEYCLNIRAFMVVLIEPFFVVSIEVIEPRPRRIFSVWLARLFEINVRHSRMALHKFEIRTATVCLVCGDFIHHEVLSGRVHKSTELWTVCAALISDDATRHDVGSNAAHQMQFYPDLFLVIFGVNMLIPLLCAAAPLHFYPARISVSREARAINGKVTLYSFERKTTLRDESVKVRREPFRFHVVRERVEMRRARQIAAPLCFLQVGVGTSTGKAAIDFQDDGKEHIRKRYARASHCLGRFFYAVA